MEAKRPSERNFINEIRALGIKDGLTIPIHGPTGCVAMLMFASNHQLALLSEDEDALGLVAITMLQRIKHIKAAALLPKTATSCLTIREMECLGWVLEGKTNWEIGVLMGVAARTVQFHLANCARKMGVHNRIQSAVRALVEGVILPPSTPQIYKHCAENNTQCQGKPVATFQCTFKQMELTNIGLAGAKKAFSTGEMAGRVQEAHRDLKFTMD
jgi:DNA-binding CsgD family transcriptional regulator